jgi:hypothetical protein
VTKRNARAVPRIRQTVHVLMRISVLVTAIGVLPAAAQIAMPDAREMSGIPRPVTDLPDGSVSVRLIRGELSNNIAKHPVELLVNGEARTVTTDENGRAQFDKLPPGARLKAVAVVDNERLESQEFPAPPQGGIRVMLVATDPERAARARAPAVPGDLALGNESRIVIEPDEETVRVFYLLDIQNRAQTPVEPRTPFIFNVPTGALSTTVMDGSAPQASASGDTVRILGPFAPGRTFVQIGYVFPTSGGRATITQAFPATFEQLVVFVQKVADARAESPQFDRQQEMPAGGDTLIVGVSDRPIQAGQPISVTVSGLPHHSNAPIWTAMTLAGVILLLAAWASWSAGRPAADARSGERARLVARREKLLQDLVKLEQDHRRGRIDAPRYAQRREELVAALEHVYGALDTIDPGAGPSSRAGIAA